MATLKINDQELFYEDSGGDGPPLLFLHGFLFDHTMFKSQVDMLTPDYRCIQLDTRGFGQTKWDGEAFDLYDIVSDCIGLLDHLGIEKVTLMGMSQGAYASVRLALRHPQRVHAMVLMSTRMDISAKEFNDNYKTLRDAWRENGAQDFLIEPLMNLLIGSKEHFGEHWARWRPSWERFPGEAMYHTMNALLARNILTEEEIRQIDVPVLSVHGLDDLGTPVGLADRLYELFPNGKGKVRVKGAAHAVNMTHPDVVNPPIREFLDTYVNI